MKIEATRPFETFVITYNITWSYKLEHRNWNYPSCENFKYETVEWMNLLNLVAVEASNSPSVALVHFYLDSEQKVDLLS